MIQDLSGSWCIRGTGESTLVMDSPVPLMNYDPDRSCITDPDPDHPKGTQPVDIRALDYSPVSSTTTNTSTASGVKIVARPLRELSIAFPKRLGY